MITYKPLSITLIKRGITKTQMRIDLKLSTSTLAKFSKNEYVALEIIDKICKYLECNVEDVIQYKE